MESVTAYPVIKLDRRELEDIPARNTPPRGDYVAYQGKYYTQNAKSGYPLEVVANVAANSPGRVVVFGQDHGILAIISGTNRKMYCKYDTSLSATPGPVSDAYADENNKKTLQSIFTALLRFTLQSNYKEVIILGDAGPLSAFPSEKLTFSDLKLPPLIKRSRTWQILSVIPLLLIAGLVTGGLINAGFISQLERQKNLFNKAQDDMGIALSEVREGREQIQAARNKAVVPLPVAFVSLGKLPAPFASFVDNYMEGVNNGDGASGEFVINAPPNFASMNKLPDQILAEAIAITGIQSSKVVPVAPNTYTINP